MNLREQQHKVGRSRGSRRCLKSYALTYSRLRKREPLIALVLPPRKLRLQTLGHGIMVQDFEIKKPGVTW